MGPMPLSLHTGFCFLNSHDSPSQSFGSTQWGEIFLKEHCILIKICFKICVLQHNSNKKSRSSWKFLIFQPITGKLCISCLVIGWKMSNYLSDTFWTCIFIEEIYMDREIIPTHCGSLSILVSLYLGSFTAILLRFWPFN